VPIGKIYKNASRRPAHVGDGRRGVVQRPCPQRPWPRSRCLDEWNYVNCEEAIADDTFSSEINAGAGKTSNGNWLHADA
jgi:hypothetical protein